MTRNLLLPLLKWHSWVPHISGVHKPWSWASSSYLSRRKSWNVVLGCWHKSSKELKRCLGMFAYYARWIRNFSGKIKPLTAGKMHFPLQKKPLTAGKMHFPLQSNAVTAFESLRKKLLSACLKCIAENEPFSQYWMRCLRLRNCRRPQPRRTTCRFHVTHLV